MSDFLRAIDVSLFQFLNGTLGNPVFDWVMPVLSDLNLVWYGRALFVMLWLLLLLKGGRRGRAAALLLIPLIVVTDQLSSSVIKNIVMRPRPCHIVDGAMAVGQVRLLVGCGGGFSFPSTHAVNNFAAAALISRFFPRWTVWLLGWAALVSFSRISVGVHYPSDVAAGMVLGILAGWAAAAAWAAAALRFDRLQPYAPPTGP